MVVIRLILFCDQSSRWPVPHHPDNSHRTEARYGPSLFLTSLRVAVNVLRSWCLSVHVLMADGHIPRVCRTKLELLSLLNKASTALAESARALDKSRKAGDPELFWLARVQVEEARLQVDKAKLIFEFHCQEHKCQTRCKRLQ